MKLMMVGKPPVLDTLVCANGFSFKVNVHLMMAAKPPLLHMYTCMDSFALEL